MRRRSLGGNLVGICIECGARAGRNHGYEIVKGGTIFCAPAAYALLTPPAGALAADLIALPRLAPGLPSLAR
ncbi:hypothetical protein SBA5_690007 [Candidatus Sulfotelmatomonas gaucii]|uniref:Uncharacterized protein n=1 Tax=Candidatus Sulfuritelmatomonas gaucii TaxID=2043161 RepID=A0A2N9LZU2_9BACT|nr:hypothetical protein SBA5_690007 [Candidatus Sulfotelmatomonas gaucii]